MKNERLTNWNGGAEAGTGAGRGGRGGRRRLHTSCLDLQSSTVLESPTEVVTGSAKKQVVPVKGPISQWCENTQIRQ